MRSLGLSLRVGGASSGSRNDTGTTTPSGPGSSPSRATVCSSCHTTFSRIVQGSGKDRSVREKVVWQEEQTVAREGLEPGPGGGGGPGSVRLPLDAPPTRRANSDDR